MRLSPLYVTGFEWRVFPWFFFIAIWNLLDHYTMSSVISQQGPSSSSRQHHHDMPIQLRQTASERHAPPEKQERWSQISASRHRPSSAGAVEVIPPEPDVEDVEEPQSEPWHHSRRVRQRLDRLGQSERDLKLEQQKDHILWLLKAERDLVDRCKELDDEIQEMRGKLERRNIQRKELKGITEELAVAQRFLSTADSLSQAEVVRAMEALNEEIFQLTSIAADKIQIQDQQYPTEEELDAEVDPRYRRIWSQNDQAVAGRWRSITSQSTDDPPPEVQERLLDKCVRALTALPVLCGYIHDQKSYEELLNDFYERLKPLLEKCLRFRRTLKEEIVSMDVRPFFVDSGETHNPSRSDLEYEDGDQPKEEKRDHCLFPRNGFVLGSVLAGCGREGRPEASGDFEVKGDS
ncbi:hypothetical protein NP233_g5881 [Leucocoprinus birnbaumii]|uniref:Uncharacterized protein n=1 Tax=Leucocoprinus birnbaumii TaxID=56174 RepID=A0AAD5VS04_9AGAR|nr:hypothetical protein NP233_g5881 [Leucocoprinus birnbaumii]